MTNVTYFDGRSWFWIDMPNHTAYGPFLVELDALESAEQTAYIAELERQHAAEPKIDRRFTGIGRSKRLRKGGRARGQL